MAMSPPAPSLVFQPQSALKIRVSATGLKGTVTVSAGTATVNEAKASARLAKRFQEADFMVVDFLGVDFGDNSNGYH
jgi:hypothetical protein